MKFLKEKISASIVLIVLATIHSSAQAIEKEATRNESLAAQLKNGTAPGLRFAPMTNALPVKDEKMEEPKNTIRAILKGTAIGIPMARASAATKAPPVLQQLPAKPMVSDSPQMVPKKEPEKTIAIPTQTSTD